MNSPERTETIRFPIAGMTCTSCVNRITRSLRTVDGVERVRVHLADEAATVRRDPSRADDQALATAVAAAGYEADLSRAVSQPTEEPWTSLLHRFLPRHRRTARPDGHDASTQENLP